MPTYEYECVGCGKKFERRQPITAPPIKTCPDCGGEVRRLISGGAGFILKGGESRAGKDCSLERSGQTCCGRSERCGRPSCGEK